MTPSLLDRARALYTRADAIVDRLGFQCYRVGVLAEGRTEAFGIDGGELTQHVRWISPTPQVRKLDTLRASALGISLGPGSALDAQRDVFEVVIPRAAVFTNAAGDEVQVGMKVSDLFPVDPSAKSRSRVVIADVRDDGELGREGVPFAIERMLPDELTITLLLVQAQVQETGL